MSLTKENLENLPKNQLIEIALKLQLDSEKRLDTLENKVTDLLSQVGKFSSSQETLLSTLCVSKNASELLSRKIKSMESELYRQQQYSRRECLEIVGIPESLPDAEVEKESISLFKKLDVVLEPRDIQACHRLRNKKRVIVKFTNRKDVQKILQNKKKLKNSIGATKMFINESLCGYYRLLFGKANALVKAKLAQKVFTRNGTVKIILLNGSYQEILHEDFFSVNFPEFKFNFN
jgi:hypothetical protein